MVQKSREPPSTGRRGRPRGYDPDIALGRALAAFWETGYAATSLDELSAATGMNRPSLYAAFGDKRALYGAALERYRAMGRAAVRAAGDPERSLREALRALYDGALSLYFSGSGEPRGCFLIGTALSEAVRDPGLRDALAEALREIDRAFAARFRAARARGELPAGAKPGSRAKLAVAVLYFLAIRSRAGESRASLKAMTEDALDLICGN